MQGSDYLWYCMIYKSGKETLMDAKMFYTSLPYDLSGSRSKNRFRLELLWGVSKILELMETDEDFTVVFDYVCDIEVHFENGFEFYQIKTHGNHKSYAYKSLTKVEGEGSILGKLYVLAKGNQNYGMKLAVVSNVPYKTQTKTQFEGCFSDLSEDEKQKIECALQTELGIQNVDLSQVFYICTPMNLKAPEEALMGKLMFSFRKIKNCEPSKPNALYRLVYETVSEKACYEYSAKEYDDIVKYKGLTREEFDKMLDCHVRNEKTGIKQAEDYIEQIKDIGIRRKYKNALAKILKISASSHFLRKVEKEISDFLLLQSGIGDTEHAIDLLSDKFHTSFPPEISNAEKIMFYVIVLGKYEEGVYDNENDI